MKLVVSLAQMAVMAARPEENLKKGEDLVRKAAERKSDLVCFPEMWTTGFAWDRSAQSVRAHEKAIERVSEMAKRYRVWINGSLCAPNEEGKASNTSVLFDPKGACAGLYRKTHLFGGMREDEHMAPGKALCVADTPWGKTGLSICYDIRFPELFRTYALKGAKVVLSPMAFPYPKLHHWKVLVRARAIENQIFMIGTNQVGSEGLGKDGRVTYCGSSVIVDPWGEAVIEANETDEVLLTATIDIGRVDEVRKSMNVLGNRRPDLYELG